MENHNIYWWNLENLFDIENSPRRSTLLQNQLKKELKGWDQNVLNQKIDNLTSIITQFSISLSIKQVLKVLTFIFSNLRQNSNIVPVLQIFIYLQMNLLK